MRIWRPLEAAQLSFSHFEEHESSQTSLHLLNTQQPRIPNVGNVGNSRSKNSCKIQDAIWLISDRGRGRLIRAKLEVNESAEGVIRGQREASLLEIIWWWCVLVFSAQRSREGHTVKVFGSVSSRVGTTLKLQRRFYHSTIQVVHDRERKEGLGEGKSCTTIDR